jgi:hypothetical protein
MKNNSHKDYISYVRKNAYKKNIGLQMLNLKRRQEALERRNKKVKNE